MKYFKTSILNIFIFTLTSCGSVKKAFTNQKKNSSDEFLVEKKSPLVMPPNYDSLPIPQSLETKNNKVDKKIEELIINKDNDVDKDNKIDDLNQNLEDTLLKKIKKQ